MAVKPLPVPHDDLRDAVAYCLVTARHGRDEALRRFGEPSTDGLALAAAHIADQLARVLGRGQTVGDIFEAFALGMASVPGPSTATKVGGRPGPHWNLHILARARVTNVLLTAAEEAATPEVRQFCLDTLFAQTGLWDYLIWKARKDTQWL